MSYSSAEYDEFDWFPPPNSLPQLKELIIETTNQVVCSTFAAACPNLTCYELSITPQFVFSVCNYVTPFIQKCPNLEQMKIDVEEYIPEEADSILLNVWNHLPKIKYLEWTQKGLSRSMAKEILMRTPSLRGLASANVLHVRKNTSVENVAAIFKVYGPMSNIQIV